MDPFFITPSSPTPLPGDYSGLCQRRAYRSIHVGKHVRRRRLDNHGEGDMSGGVVTMVSKGNADVATRRRRRRSVTKTDGNGGAGDGKKGRNRVEKDGDKEVAVDSSDIYVPLHVHSDFSLLDGASQLNQLVDKAAEMGIPALALTDHGVLYGAIQLINACKAKGIKPIVGNEMYVVDDFVGNDEGRESGVRVKRYHLIVLAKNTAGYRNLVKLTSIAHLKGMKGRGMFARPCVNKELLYAYREGLIVSSACLGGEIPQALLNGDSETAEQVARWYRDVFGKDFYLEIQDHGQDEDRIVNKGLIELSNRLGIALIATNDSHFTTESDAPAHDALICVKTGKALSDKNRMRYTGHEYFKSGTQLKSMFADYLSREVVDRALRNTLKLAEGVETYHIRTEKVIPDFPIPAHYSHLSHDDYLGFLARAGLRALLDRRKNKEKLEKVESIYKDRLEYELNMITRMGFTSYFLVVWDYIRYARDAGIPVGPGRGSVAGSLAAFALGITGIDPVEHGLLFERFLNPDRNSMPDIDTDFSVEGRERVISYVTSKYGADRVAQIVTFNRLTTKAVLKDVARVHGISYSQADELAKAVPVFRGKPTSLGELIGVYDEEECSGGTKKSEKTSKKESEAFKDFRELYEQSDAKAWVEKARRIEGVNKGISIHAAGVVISSEPLTHLVPLSVAKHGETITQYPMEDVESVGLLKMDFLGLKNLSVIESAVSLINARNARLSRTEDRTPFDINNVPLDDAPTYKLLANGPLDGVFQLDASAGMQSVVRELAPSSLSDISSVLALYRPGPLDAGLIPKFIARKHGREPIEFAHKLLEPILGETYGILVYQEQIMSAAQVIAGYTMSQADLLRRAMGKKKVQEMMEQRPRFIAGAMKNGVSESIATKLFEEMEQFAHYCFNKSHSTAYAYLTYQTAYLKANYPVEYMAALLAACTKDPDRLQRLLGSASSMGIRIRPPDVNQSHLGFTVAYPDNSEPLILFGLSAISGVGKTVANAIIKERDLNGKYSSIIDLSSRLHGRALNKKALSSLIYAGAFDSMYSSRRGVMESLEAILECRTRVRNRQATREKRIEKKKQRDLESGGSRSLDTLGVDDEDCEERRRLDWEEAEFKLEENQRGGREWFLIDKLQFEKAAIGFYASGHPLDDLDPFRKVLACDGASSISEEKSEELVRVLGVVTGLKKLTTSTGSKMGRLMVEDKEGRIPTIVFPSNYPLLEQKSGNVDCTDAETPESVRDGSRVVVWGKISKDSNNDGQLIVDDIMPVEDIQVLIVDIPASEFDRKVSFLERCIIRHGRQNGSLDSESEAVDYGGRRYRRRKKMNLSTKARVPVVVRTTNHAGKSDGYVSLNPQLRCSNLKELQELVMTDLNLNAQTMNFKTIMQLAEVRSAGVVAETLIRRSSSATAVDQVNCGETELVEETQSAALDAAVHMESGQSVRKHAAVVQETHSADAESTANRKEACSNEAVVDDLVSASTGDSAIATQEDASTKRGQVLAVPSLSEDLEAEEAKTLQSTKAQQVVEGGLGEVVPYFSAHDDKMASSQMHEAVRRIREKRRIYLRRQRERNRQHRRAAGLEDKGRETIMSGLMLKSEDELERGHGSDYQTTGVATIERKSMWSTTSSQQFHQASPNYSMAKFGSASSGGQRDWNANNARASLDFVNNTLWSIAELQELLVQRMTYMEKHLRLVLRDLGESESSLHRLSSQAVNDSTDESTLKANGPPGGSSDIQNVRKSAGASSNSISDKTNCIISREPALETGIEQAAEDKNDQGKCLSSKDPVECEKKKKGGEDDTSEFSADEFLEAPSPRRRYAKDRDEKTRSSDGANGTYATSSTERRKSNPRRKYSVYRELFTFDKNAMSKIIDASCFVASEVGSKHSEQLVRTVMVNTVKVMSSYEEVGECVLEGQLANVRGNFMDVLVVARETSATGHRENSRSVLTVLVTLETELPATPLESTSKAAASRKERAIKGIAGVKNIISEDNNRKEDDMSKQKKGGRSTVNSSQTTCSTPKFTYDDSVGADRGELLMWMSELAVRCAQHVTGTNGLTLLENVVAFFRGESIPESSSKTCTLNAEVQCVDFDKVVVRVALLSDNGAEVPAWASIKVRPLSWTPNTVLVHPDESLKKLALPGTLKSCIDPLMSSSTDR